MRLTRKRQVMKWVYENGRLVKLKTRKGRVVYVRAVRKKDLYKAIRTTSIYRVTRELIAATRLREFIGKDNQKYVGLPKRYWDWMEKLRG